MTPPGTLAATLREHALSLPEAWADTPWEGDNVAKVRRKIFAFLPADDAGSLGVKLPTSGGFALSLPCAVAMGYGLGRHGWVTVHLRERGLPRLDVFRDWVTESYSAVAPATLARRLGAAPLPSPGGMSPPPS